MSSVGTYYTYETDSQGNYVLDASGNKIVETTWTISDAGLGASNVTIADSSGNTVETLTGVPDSLLRGYHIQTGTSAVNGSLVSVIGGDWVSVPGSTGTIDIVLSALSAPVFTIGGTTDINFLVNAAAAITVDVYGGTASFSGGLVAGALSGSTINIGYGGTYNGNTQLVSLLQGTTVNFTTGGGTLVLNGGGVFLNLSGTTIAGYDPSKDTIEIQNTVAPISGYIISGSGDTRTITLIGSDGTQSAEYTVTVASGANVPVGTYNNSVNSADLETNPLRITYANGNTYIGACFLVGSMIRTSKGEVAVEDVQIGDVLSVFDWRNNAEISRAVTWVGNQKVVVRGGLPDDEAGYPVRVLKDAIADGVPYKDMLITPEHCLFFEESFVPVRMLVNGRSIFYDKTITSYTYYHVETESHSVIWADGVLTESYLDTGNRSSFKQHGNLAVLGGGREKSWEKDGGASLTVARNFVEPLFRAIDQRAEVAGVEWKKGQPVLTEDADMHLVTEAGATIRQVREHDGYIMFMIPASVEKVRIISKASRPTDVIGPFVDDRRQLGVAIGEITLFESGRRVSVTSHLADTEVEGWHGLEGTEARWTTGNAVLPLGKRPSAGVAMLIMRVMAAGPYLMAGQDTELMRVSV